MEETHVVTCFLRNRGEVLLLERSGAVGSYAGRWGAVSGHAEGDPDAAAREEIAEEADLLSACALVRAGEPFSVEDSEARSASESRAKPGDPDLDTRWVVHPYLFDCERRDAETNWETDDAEWVPPTETLRRETVPDLWAAYERVAPTVESVREDADHGSAYVSVRALEVLRDRAGWLAESASRRALGEDGDFEGRGDHRRDDFEGEGERDSGGWSQLTTLADELLEARPSMAALGNRVNRAMATAADDASGVRGRTPEAVERAAREGIERAFRTDEEAAENAAAEIRGEVVLTLSRSGTVLDALGAADRAFVAESRPAREGVGVAEELAAVEDAPEVTLHTDAAVAHVLATADADAVLVGADAILPDGRVVNKTGTRGMALAANREGIPCYAVAASDKVRTDDEVYLEDGPPEAVYDADGDADVRVLNPTFDVTPADLVSGAITERGVLDEAGISEVADELRELSEW